MKLFILVASSAFLQTVVVGISGEIPVAFARPVDQDDGSSGIPVAVRVDAEQLHDWPNGENTPSETVPDSTVPDSIAKPTETSRNVLDDLVKVPFYAYRDAKAAVQKKSCPYEAPSQIQQNFAAKLVLVRSKSELDIICADTKIEFELKDISEEQSKWILEVCDNEQMKEKLAEKFSYPNLLPGRACPEMADYRLTEKGLTKPNGKRASNMIRGNQKCMKKIVRLISEDQAAQRADTTTFDSIDENSIRNHVDQTANEVVIKSTELQESLHKQGQTKLACKMSKIAASFKSLVNFVATTTLVAVGTLFYLLALAMAVSTLLLAANLNPVALLALGVCVAFAFTSYFTLREGFKLGMTARGTTPYIDYMNDVTKRAREQETPR